MLWDLSQFLASNLLASFSVYCLCFKARIFYTLCRGFNVTFKFIKNYVTFLALKMPLGRSWEWEKWFVRLMQFGDEKCCFSLLLFLIEKYFFSSNFCRVLLWVSYMLENPVPTGFFIRFFTVYPVFTCFHREDLPARMAEVEECFSAENPSSLLQVQTRHLLRCWTRSPRRRSCPNRPTCRPQMRSSSWRSNHPSIERSVEQKHVKHLDLWNNILKIKRCNTNTVGIWMTY